MIARIHRWLFLTSTIFLAACTVERTTHLYPTNDAATQTGVLEGHFVGHGNLHGIADLSMPDGEILKGEYSIVPYGSDSSFLVSADGHGEAIVYGDNKTVGRCKFENNNYMGHGYGDCELSTGETYDLKY
jgi:hypothetical protein